MSDERAIDILTICTLVRLIKQDFVARKLTNTLIRTSFVDFVPFFGQFFLDDYRTATTMSQTRDGALPRTRRRRYRKRHRRAAAPSFDVSRTGG
jgi:hypothetical protein